jgi:hypothetical protein
MLVLFTAICPCIPVLVLDVGIPATNPGYAVACTVLSGKFKLPSVPRVKEYIPLVNEETLLIKEYNSIKLAFALVNAERTLSPFPALALVPVLII